MCGIAGALDGSIGRRELRERTAAMVATLAHRGPDGEGVWVDGGEEGGGLALGHRRLAIVDLSEQGRQPMPSSSGRFVISYNGEVYNFRELRAELEAASSPSFRSGTDTEVILAAVERWGVEGTLRRLNGMFALALWDRAARTLTLARDRIGIKPLYYGRSGGSFLFASELGAMRAWPGFQGDVDLDAIRGYLRYGYVPSPRSAYRGVRKLPPGSFLTLPQVDAERGGDGRLRAFWSAEEMIGGRVLRTDAHADDIADELDGLITDAVRRQMVADVPVGAFLSGGIDSSTVVAVMQSVSPRPVKTYSIGFDERAWTNEARHAKRVAEHLGTDHTELYVTDREVREVAPLLPRIYDEPFGDSSQLPTHLVSRLAREEVTVALSGDGGDELFLGYDRYRFAPRAWRRVARLPGPVRRVLARSLPRRHRPGGWLDGLLDGASAVVPGAPNPQTTENIRKLLLVEGMADLYDWSVGAWTDADRLIAPHGLRGAGGCRRTLSGKVEEEISGQLSLIDLVGYLPDDILTKVDRASMAVGLEVRVPLLDHQIVEYARTLPEGVKLREDGRGKEVLRRVLHGYVPEELVERPKSGFVGPVGAWLRGPLRAWADELFLSGADAGGRADWLNGAEVRRLWSDYLGGRERSSDKVWRTAMLLAWLRDGRRGTTAASARGRVPAPA